MPRQRLTIAVGLLALSGCGRGAPADLILRNAAVYTMATPARAQAIAIRSGKIVYVGSDSGAARWAGKNTEVLDWGGRMILPGFHDTHTHPEGGIGLTDCILDNLPDASAILDSVRRCHEAKPDTGWLRGRGWALPAFREANPRKELLDAIAPNRPVFLSAADGHSAWVNSKALAVAGVTAATPDPANGRIERTAAGEPSGTLREAAMDLVSSRLPPHSLEEMEAGITRALALAHRYGITTLHDAAVSPRLMEAYATLDRKGELAMRVIGTQWIDPAKGAGQIDSLLAWKRRYAGTTYFRATGAKLVADGVIEAGTAALLAPYLGRSGPNAAGTPNFTQPAMDSIVTRLGKEGIQVHVHAIGDRAIRMSLDAIEAAQRVNGPGDRRPIIAHLELIDPADLPRFKTLGVVASFQPLWAFPDPYIRDLTIPVLGPTRSRWLYPIGSMVRTGAVVAAGSDWPVSSMNPLEAIQVALTRRDPADSAGPPWIPEETVDLDTMLRAYTVNGALASFDERTTGTLEVGKAADIIVLDQDLYRIPPAAIGRVKVLLTLIDGKEVYRDPVVP